MRAVIVLTILLIFTSSYAKDTQGSSNISFKFAPASIDSDTLKNRMEKNISDLLSEINRAESTGSTLDLSGIDMIPLAKDRLTALWNIARFTCDKSVNISKCQKDYRGYQARSIPITIKPYDSAYNESLNRALTISLNHKGQISGVYLALESKEAITKILTYSKGEGVQGAQIRKEILKWIEEYQTLYSCRDIKGITNKLNALPSIEESKDKKQLINDLTQMLADKSFQTILDYIYIQSHGFKPNIYGLTFHQQFKTEESEEEGWVFMFWDFNDPENPQIHFTTWQTEEDVKKDGVKTLDDFFIP